MRIIYSKDEGLKNKFIRNEIKLFNSLIDERPNEKTINQLYNELSKDKLKLVDGVYKFNFRELMKFACSRKVKLKNGVIEVTADNLKEIVKEKVSLPHIRYCLFLSISYFIFCIFFIYHHY